MSDRSRRWLAFAAILATVIGTGGVRADTVTIAVASNFKDAAGELARRFETTSNHRVRLIPGSSGRLYAQIVNGAPFDVFLSADVFRPMRLEDDALAVAGSRFTYAIGELVVWSADAELAGTDCLGLLQRPDGKKIAIANPMLAPYGGAAKSYLQTMGWWQGVQDHLVMGENIAQVLQFTATGNAGVGLIARSQLQTSSLPPTACEYHVPGETHPPIEQQVVRLSGAPAPDVANEFLSFLRTSEARDVIRDFGYRAPPATESGP